eukprot:276788-Prorocentrum_minimum.AAC.1
MGDANAFPAHNSSSPSPAKDASGDTSTASPSTVPPAACQGVHVHLYMWRGEGAAGMGTGGGHGRRGVETWFRRRARAVSGESAGDPGAFFTGANCSARFTCGGGRRKCNTSVTHARSARGGGRRKCDISVTRPRRRVT